MALCLSVATTVRAAPQSLLSPTAVPTDRGITLAPPPRPTTPFSVQAVAELAKHNTHRGKYKSFRIMSSLSSPPAYVIMANDSRGDWNSH